MLRNFISKKGFKSVVISNIFCRQLATNPLDNRLIFSKNGTSAFFDRLALISNEQKEFLFGTSGKEFGENFFDSINKKYADMIKQTQRKEMDIYIEKQRKHYIRRLDEEVTEFAMEQADHLKDFERHELNHFQNELLNDVKEFSDQRQNECRRRLEEDVRKYQISLCSTKSEDSRISSSSPSSSRSAELVSAYVDRRHNFYELLLNNEIVEFAHKRKVFYEELLQTRLQRKAESFAVKRDNFQANREAYYKEKLERDVEWMSNSFQGHYEKCFLQCFSRYAWLMYRQSINDANRSSKGPNFISDLVNKIPLSIILAEYEKETLSDSSSDVFFKAARRLIIEE